ncbi:uncharacterized protein [Choristoneura fumiferana]|uniref:uncharacterized protein n=1 Tax=Choristoneura fumiferana TaxID=7141 RepID=UPI003D1564F4
MTGAATRRPAHKTPPHTPGGDTVARTREQRESAKVQSARGKEKESDAARKRQGNTEGSLGTQRTTPSEIQVGRSRYPYTSYTDHSGSPVKLSATRGNKDGYMNIYSIKAKYPTQAKVRNVPRAEWYEGFAKCLPHLLLSHSLTNLFPQRYLLLLSYSNILFLPLLLLPYVLLLPALRGWKTQTCPRQPYSWNVAPLVWLAVHKAHRQPMPRRPLNDDDIVAALNMGSESDSDDSDEEGSSQPFIPRILGAILETPEDDDESTDDSPSLSPPLRSILLASASSSSSNTPVKQRDFLDFKWRAFPSSRLLLSQVR